jgi:hypothetical protein
LLPKTPKPLVIVIENEESKLFIALFSWNCIIHCGQWCYDLHVS